MKEELIKRLLKFISVKVFVFTVLSILVLLGRDISYLAPVAIVFFTIRGLQYYLHSKEILRK